MLRPRAENHASEEKNEKIGADVACARLKSRLLTALLTASFNRRFRLLSPWRLRAQQEPPSTRTSQPRGRSQGRRARKRQSTSLQDDLRYLL